MTEMKWTPGPWFVSGVRFKMNGGEWHSVNRYDEDRKRDENIACVGYDPRTGAGTADAHLIAAAPEMAEALQAEEEADRLFDVADEYTHRAEGEGWLNDPTGSMHVTEAWDRARQARERAKELRRAAFQKAGG